ncbi:MAG: chain-length determining protein [Bacteroidales bacterium]|nr:chain-length determining protein [Bacteroidales bacterium]
MEKEKKKPVIDVREIIASLWKKKWLFVKVWCIVLVLSALWIFPQPRYYTAEVSLAPETAGTEVGGGLAGIAAQFGFNLGGSGNDAFYPVLYPELFSSPAFLVSLWDIQVETLDGETKCDYYTYLKNQKKNPYTVPFKAVKRWVRSLFVTKKQTGTGVGASAFQLSEDDYGLMMTMQEKIICKNDKKTDVTTIVVEAQDPLVCALMADSVRSRLQKFLIDYRTSKARLDLAYYQALSDSAFTEYQISMKLYNEYCDTHKNIIQQSSQSQKDVLASDLEMKKTTYQAYQAQVQAMRSKVQEKTPAFTTLKSATVPVKPDGPKRVIFILAMLFLSTIVTGVCVCKKMLPAEI